MENYFLQLLLKIIIQNHGIIIEDWKIRYFIFFVGFAIFQLNNLLEVIEKKNYLSTQIIDYIQNLTEFQSYMNFMRLEQYPGVVYWCALLNIYLALGFLLNWKYVKSIGILYLIFCTPFVNNPIFSQSIADSYLFQGIIGTLMLA
ncbi:unnamed protein product [Paramecium octaurelia]|uniref:Uncharacterized protein n=1 Tax=Paramecium octaurelia TaxID=43137 RepID=A0A8S1UYT7_PAROT|nr:unnamed protein product [Paramecium octaurelia]